jgi:hypothetical protein
MEAPPVPAVDLTVYAGDSVVFGRLALTADRVTDLMNGSAEFEFDAPDGRSPGSRPSS